VSSATPHQPKSKATGKTHKPAPRVGQLAAGTDKRAAPTIPHRRAPDTPSRGEAAAWARTWTTLASSRGRPSPRLAHDEQDRWPLGDASPERPTGPPSESLQIAQRSPGCTPSPPSSTTRSRAEDMSATRK